MGMIPSAGGKFGFGLRKPFSGNLPVFLFGKFLVHGGFDAGVLGKDGNKIGLGFVSYAFSDGLYREMPVAVHVAQAAHGFLDSVLVQETPEVLVVFFIDSLGYVTAVGID